MRTFVQLIFRMTLTVCFVAMSSEAVSVAQPNDPSDFATEDTYTNYAPPMPSGASTESMLGDGGEAVGISSVSDKITLELKGVNVLDVLKILAKRSGLNIVAGRDVRGDVTLYMQNVEVQRALDTIVDTLGLAYDERDGIITVMSNKEFVSRYGKPFRDDRITRVFHLKYANPQNMNQLVQQMKSAAGKIAVDEKTGIIIVTDISEVVDEIEHAVKEFDQPLITKTFTLNYAKSGDVGEEFKDYLTPNVGVLKIDKRANQITVTDRGPIVDLIGGVIESFDARPLQVLIDSKVVEVELYDAYRFGIDWSYVDLKAGSIKNVSLDPNNSVSAPSSTLGGGTLSAITIGTSEGNDSLRSVINFLSNVGKTNTLSSPRLLVLNNEEAKLAVATREPFVQQSTTSNQSTTTTADQVTFIDVGVTLSVVPTISENGNIILKIKPEVSTAGTPLELEGAVSGSTTTFVRSRIPVVTTQTLETTVVVKDGNTVVLGGLIQDNQTKTRKKVPVLGDIPLLGAAFRTEVNDFNKTELVIFLTPHIIQGKASSKELEKYINENGYFKEMNEVGGYDFTKAETTSPQGAFRMNDKPYYGSLTEERPVYFPSRDTAQKVVKNQGKLNENDDGTGAKPVVVTANTASVSNAPVEEVKPSSQKPLNVTQGSKKSEEIVPEKQLVTKAPDRITTKQPSESVTNSKYSKSVEARKKYGEAIASAIRDALALRKDLGRYPLDLQIFVAISKSGKLTLKRVVKDSGLSPSGQGIVLDTIQKLSPFPPFPAEMESDEELFDFSLQLT